VLLRGNLHAHTTFSDGVRTPEGLVGEYERLGYDFLAITDHFDHDNLVHPDYEETIAALESGLLIFRGIYLNSVPTSRLPADAAAALFDALVAFIKQGLRTVLVAGLVVAAGAFLAGPSVTAVRIRGAFTRGLGRIRHGGEQAGVRTGPVGTWTYAHRRALRISAVALAVLVFVFWGQPTALVAIVIAILLLVVLGLVELIGSRPPSQPEAAGHP